jgi:hypothetical protein
MSTSEFGFKGQLLVLHMMKAFQEAFSTRKCGKPQLQGWELELFTCPNKTGFQIGRAKGFRHLLRIIERVALQ